jgi:hypothetical protein
MAYMFVDGNFMVKISCFHNLQMMWGGAGEEEEGSMLCLLINLQVSRGLRTFFSPQIVMFTLFLHVRTYTITYI